MAMLIGGLVLFFAAHAVPIVPGLRARLVEGAGEGAFKGLFSVVSLAGLLLIVMGYGVARQTAEPLWEPPVWAGHLAATLMIFAMIALAAAYIPSRIRTLLKHPMLVAIKIWALAHLLAIGDLVSLILFGSFLAYAVIDRISVKRRGAMGPLGAAKCGLGGDVAAVAVGLIAYAVLLFWGHAYLFGVAPIPGVSA